MARIRENWEFLRTTKETVPAYWAAEVIEEAIDAGVIKPGIGCNVASKETAWWEGRIMDRLEAPLW